jgi:hypothetical protein
MTLQEALKNSNFLDNLSLEKKEFYRWLALELEERMETFTVDKIKDDIKKVCLKINWDIFKVESQKLKDIFQTDKNNIEALIKYNTLLKKAKEVKIV